jgi:hypothetical protein
MKINVPFIYEALVIKPRCRKPSLIIIRDAIEVNIQEVDAKEFPVAMRVGSEDIRWDGKQLWNFDYHCVHRERDKKVLVSTVKQNTEDGGVNYKYSRSTAEAPFHFFWENLDDCMLKRHNVRLCGMRTRLCDDGVVTKENAVYREWIDDNRDAVIEKAVSIAS